MSIINLCELHNIKIICLYYISTNLCKMKHYLALLTIFFLWQVSSVESFMQTNSKRCIGGNCGIDKYIAPTPKLKKIIRDLLKKSEKIKNILIYPEPDDKEDWESGEIPWEPQSAANETYSVNTTVTDGETNSLTSYNLGMLFI